MSDMTKRTNDEIARKIMSSANPLLSEVIKEALDAKDSQAERELKIKLGSVRECLKYVLGSGRGSEVFPENIHTKEPATTSYDKCVEALTLLDEILKDTP